MNALDDKLYARTEKFLNNMNNLLLRIKGEATKVAKRQTRSNISEGQLVGALIIGVAIGAASSLLFAPRSGKETRDKLASNFKDVTNKVTDWEKSQTEKLKNLSQEADRKIKQSSTGTTSV